MSYRIRVYREDGSFWVSEFRDDATRIVTTYNEVGDILTTRPYTSEEDITADQIISMQQAAIAYENNRQIVKTIITDLQIEKTRAQTIIDKAGANADTKEVARAVKRVADAAIDLARFIS